MVRKSSELKNNERLINSWIAMHHAQEDSAEYKENIWAEFELSKLAQDDPETCWQLILEILQRDQSPKVLQGLAAGALEDLLGSHGPEFIDRVEERAQVDKPFQRLLGGVWQNEIPENIWKRVQAVSGNRW
jgi:uncharacterized protein DUF6869